jgi:hypothetical protein
MDPLATVDDLEARLGRDLTADEAARADALLADASALVRGYVRQHLAPPVSGDQVVLRPVGTLVRLPQRPVTAVTSVAAVGPDGAVIGALSGWSWDGRDLVDLACATPSGSWPLTGRACLPDTYRITYDHGYTETPADIVAVICAMVLRTLLAPSPVAGMVSERIGQYNYQLQQGTGSVGATVLMTQADRDALRDYRRTATTIQTRAG